MKYDKDKVDEVTLALLSLVTVDGCRAWKGFDWDTMSRLHEKGFISDPKGKTKTVFFTDKGLQRSEELFRKFFARED